MCFHEKKKTKNKLFTACSLKWIQPDTLPLPLTPPSLLLPPYQALPECHRLLRTVAKQYCHMRTLFRQLAHLSPAIQAADSQWFSYVEFRWAVSVSE